jgi:hypothetical protein
MNRSKDLDTIAPDDPILPKEKKEKISVKNIKKKEVCRSDYDTPTIYNSDIVKKIVGHTKSSLSSVIVCPKSFTFSEKNKDETILVVLRPHWFTNFSWIFIAGLLAISPILFPLFKIKQFLPDNILRVVVFFWYLFLFAFLIEKFISWYYDLSIITNQRVIDIDVSNILDRRFREAQINKIQDTSYKVMGVSQSFLNYGTLRIETAGENPNLVFENIARPSKIAKLLQNLCYKNNV